MNTLTHESMGDSVRELQGYLGILCHYSGERNGRFDEATSNALKTLQDKMYLLPSGELDEATEIELDIFLGQQRGALGCLGFWNNDNAQGNSDALQQGLIEFQADQNLPQSGCLDQATRYALVSEISKLQSKLFFLGDYKGFVDGSFNPFIIPAIQVFQTRHKLPINGIRDPVTRVAISESALIKPDQGEVPDRAKQEKVAAIQRKLYCSGHYRGGQHGRYDNATVTALIAFQQKHKLPRTDGFCDDRTWWQLNQESGTIFSEVFQWELDALDEEGSDVIPDKADPRPAAESEVIARAHKNQLFGLAFSGGGIRSATFNLGMSQALAEKQLLREFHYLSTVSGGGYIGSWLAKWIYEEGGEIEKVEEKLSIANRPAGSTAEPDQIKFLRHYLTPQVGFFGADTWAVIATYLRNVMLNMAILVAVLSAVMLFPRVLLWIVTQYSSAVKIGELYTPGFALWFGSIALAAFLVAVFFISLNISLVAHPRNQQRWLYCQEQSCVLTRVVVPLMISGFFGSVWLWYEFEGAQPYFMDWHYWLVAGLIYLSVWGIAWRLGQQINGENGVRTTQSGGDWSQVGLHLIFSIAALIIGHGMIAFVLTQFERPTKVHDPLNHPVNLVTFGMAVALSIFGIAMILLVGLLGRAYSDRSREWWSRMGGWTIIFTIGWVVLSTISLYGPPFITWLNYEIAGWVLTIIILGCLLASAFGARYGMSERSGETLAGPTTDRLLAIAPRYLVLGVLLLTTAVIQWLAPAMFVLGMLLFTTSVILSLITGESIHNASVTTIGDYFNTSFFNSEETPIDLLVASIAGCVMVAVILVWRVDINKFSMYMLYRNRLVRCYLGASNANRSPDPFTGFDIGDDRHLAELLWKLAPDNNGVVHHLQKPFHLINTSVNLVTGKEYGRQQRRAASFLFSPGFCGFDPPKDAGHLKPTGANVLARACFRATREYGAGKRDVVGSISLSGLREKLECFRDEEEGVTLGQAMAISGSAASPNIGYHSNPALSFLMTALNARLGRWSANPGQDAWRTPGPSFGFVWPVSDLLGLVNADSHYVYLTDGGHFENLGIYELVRRRCALIVAIDASSDAGCSFNDLGGAVRKSFTDFGIEIDIQVTDIEFDPVTKLAKSHWAIGEIKYGLVDANCESGLLLYVKPSLIGNEPADLLNYRNIDRKFPNQSTADQFFDETQFESYRKLGYHIGRSVLSDICAELDQNRIVGRERRQALLTLLYDKFKAAQSSAKAGTT